ncbi:P-type conjugative transfer protein TrbJ [Escherichia coli]|nr:P-type conjugative transfer protein TrbJ [Escherichia coli]
MPPVLWRGWIPFCRCTEEKKVRNKQVVLLIAGISGIVTGIIVSLNIPFIRQGLFYPASPVEIVVSLSLTFSVSVVFFVGAIVGWISVSEIYYSRMTGLNESSEISEELIMRENKSNPELKIRSTERDYKYISRITGRYAGLSLVFLTAGIVLWTVMDIIFDACIDSWKADPELNNLSYMWNILIYAIPYTLYALAAGFLVTFFSVPNVRINIRKYRDIPAEMSYAPGEHIKGGQE